MPTPKDLEEKVAPQTEEKKKGPSFAMMLQAYAPEINKALPAHMKANADRYMRLAVTEFKKNPTLAKCDPRDVFASIILATQLGLEIGVLGQAWMIPYKNYKTGGYDVQLIPGWQGHMELLHRAGKANAWTGAVFEGDEFDWSYGDTPFVKHKPCGEDDIEKLTHVYAVGRIKGQEYPVIQVWPVSKCERHRNRYNKVGSRHYSYENWEMYCRKIVLLQVLKYLPRSAEMSAAIALEAAADSGMASPDLTEAIDGEFTFIEPEDKGGEGGDPPPATGSGEMSEEEKLAAIRREREGK